MPDQEQLVHRAIVEIEAQAAPGAEAPPEPLSEGPVRTGAT